MSSGAEKAVLVAGAGLALAWAVGRSSASRAATYYTDDSKLKEDWALVPIAQRAGLARDNGWAEVADNGKPRPITETEDAERVELYWRARLMVADGRAAGDGAGEAVIQVGPRTRAFNERMARAKGIQAHAPASIVGSTPWSSLPGPLSDDALIAFWRAIDSASTTVHGVLSQIERDEVAAMFREIGVNFTGTMAELIEGVAGAAADVAATAAAVGFAALLEHPIFLAAIGIAVPLYLRGR